MKILAFETSCDDTAVAIVENGTQVLGQKRVSQTAHSDWGGVVPEIAARLHAENWRPALEGCLDEAGLSIKDIDAIACTQGPGLQTSLLTGTTAASFLSALYQKPLIPVHHIYGHLCSVFINREISDIEFPALVLTVSGGHTAVYLWENATVWQKIGGTLDDAAGEAFDKVAKMCGLGYPGGPIVSQKAEFGDPQKYKLPIPNLGKDSLDFSFSGVKAAVRRLVDSQESLEATFVCDLCASFQWTVGRIFEKKVKLMFEKFPETKGLYFVGGVSANSHIKSVLLEFLQQHGKMFLTPDRLEYSTDNAVMIGSAAYFLYEKNPDIAQIQFVEAHPRISL